MQVVNLNVPSLTLQFDICLSILDAGDGSSLLDNHLSTTFLQLSTLEPPVLLVNAASLEEIFWAASFIAFWHVLLQHSLTGSTFRQASRSFDESMTLSNASTLLTGHDPSVALER
jgi:hypothetical protein